MNINLLSLKEGAQQALRHLEATEPYRPQPPYIFEIECASTFTARFLAKLSNIEYDGIRTIRYITESYMDLYNMSTVLLYLTNSIVHPTI